MGRPLLMGVVNVTPDSFYAGSRVPSARAAAELAFRLAEEGADAIDIGGQSTRPGSDPVSLNEEISRVMPVLERLSGRLSAPFSIDTDKAEVARRAREAGAAVLNDVSALRSDPGMPETARTFEAVILMHRGGDGPKTMQQAPAYADVTREVERFFEERREVFTRAGGEAGRLLFDPGIGFGKTLEHNLTLLRDLPRLSKLGLVALGVSRKSFLGRIVPDDGPEERLEGSIAAACWAALSGVRVLRVHDLKATLKALDTLRAIRGEA